MQHFHAVKGKQSSGNLFNDSTHCFKVWCWMIDHPLGQCLSIDKLGDDIEKVALSGLQAGL